MVPDPRVANESTRASFVVLTCPGCDAWTLEHSVDDHPALVDVILREHLANCPRLQSIAERRGIAWAV